MGIYSNTWAYKVIVICGHIWTYIVILSDTWPNNHGYRWADRVIYGNIWTNIVIHEDSQADIVTHGDRWV